MISSPDLNELLALSDADKIKRFDAMVKATFSHVDGRDLLREIHPRRQLDIKRRMDGRETWFEGDWLSNLWTERNGGHGRVQNRPDHIPVSTFDIASHNAAVGDEKVARHDHSDGSRRADGRGVAREGYAGEGGGMTTNWHGPHRSVVEDHRETQRLGSVRPLDAAGIRPREFVACGVYHRLGHFFSFAEAQAYLDGTGNRPAVSASAWSVELYD